MGFIMIETIEYNGNIYPHIQAEGFAAQYAFPFAAKYCKGVGFDVGCNRKEWAYPDAIMVDPVITGYDAMMLPWDVGQVDYIFSSHMIEHAKERIGTVLEYWLSHLNDNGVIFLYLPNCDYQKYWAFGNKKHVHYVNPAIMRGICEELGVRHIVTDGYDLNGSFYCVIEK